MDDRLIQLLYEKRNRRLYGRGLNSSLEKDAFIGPAVRTAIKTGIPLIRRSALSFGKAVYSPISSVAEGIKSIPMKTAPTFRRLGKEFKSEFTSPLSLLFNSLFALGAAGQAGTTFGNTFKTLNQPTLAQPILKQGSISRKSIRGLQVSSGALGKGIEVVGKGLQHPTGGPALLAGSILAVLLGPKAVEKLRQRYAGTGDITYVPY